jgi:Ser/Thr protein kinase RdoA (MazF antagonist)
MGIPDPATLLLHFGLDPASHSVQPHGSGLINRTWVVTDRAETPRFILQRLNTNVFRRPEDVAHNLDLLKSHLANHPIDYLLPLPISNLQGDATIHDDEGCYRLIPYVPDSLVHTVCSDSSQAYEAALQFGRFTAVFDGMDTSRLRETIPGFHDLSHRWHQFEEALRDGDPSRRRESRDPIDFLQSRRDIVDTYERICADPSFRLRVTHHDTKISNVLFDRSGKGLCVIDLDTVMPGRFISDVGDMYRTYLSPVSEEESDMDRISIRPGFKKAIRDGYLVHMSEHLTSTESEHFEYAGEFMIYMQALRFLTDHLNRDVYYGASYEGHNLVRASNQARLLQAFTES